MDNRAIGVFDSGLGGLTAVRTIRQLMPGEDIIYFADSGRVPYGTKSPGELRMIAAQDVDFLSRRNVKLIIAACGTVSSNAASVLRESSVPVIGLVDCSARAMLKAGRGGALGIIATEASLKSGAFQRAMRALGEQREILSQPCPDFVTLIEGGHTERGDGLLKAAVEKYLAEMKRSGITALLLGCTHFGIIEDSIREFLGDGVELVSAADCLARELEEYIRDRGLQGGCGRENYFTSGPAEQFARQARVFLGRQITEVEHIALPEERE